MSDDSAPTEAEVAREIARGLWRRMAPPQQADIRASWSERFPNWLDTNPTARGPQRSASAVSEPRFPDDLGMVCTDSDDGRHEAGALVEEACRRLRATRETVVDEAIADLHHTHGVPRIEIITDQWHAVRSHPYGDDPGVVAACDEPTHGILAVWKHYADTQQPAPES